MSDEPEGQKPPGSLPAPSGAEAHPPNILQRNVADRLEQIGKNAYFAAHSSGLAPGFIRDILNNKKRNVRYENLQRLATALNWTIPDLFDPTPVFERARAQTETSQQSDNPPPDTPPPPPPTAMLPQEYVPDFDRLFYLLIGAFEHFGMPTEDAAGLAQSILRAAQSTPRSGADEGHQAGSREAGRVLAFLRGKI